ncbi:hypothetical protein XENTR_v10010399 [Xenopus tropicalis]|nr:hypothetical protein XENTR_v10010399 [Xenopus tropicalis]
MHKVNQTSGISFLLLGFQNSQIINEFLFVPFLWIYIVTLFGNLLIIILVITVSALRSPMYALLSQLSLADVLLSTKSSEFYLLTAMAYDRYLAICSPLHYASIMGFRLCLYMSLCSWGLAIMLSVLINYKAVELTDIILLIPFMLLPFCFIIYTYVSIGLAILRISSTEGRHKAFSTCSSHLIVVCMYYGTIIIVYMVPSKGYNFNIKKMLSLLYTVGTPCFNPIVYSLRNNDIRVALRKYMSNQVSFYTTFKQQKRRSQLLC